MGHGPNSALSLLLAFGSPIAAALIMYAFMKQPGQGNTNTNLAGGRGSATKRHKKHRRKSHKKR